MENEGVVGTAEASRILGVKQDTVTRLCRNGKFPHAEQDGIGHPWHIPMKDIEVYKATKKSSRKSRD